MKVQIENVKAETYSESKEYLQRQQDIDTALVLSKLLEPGVMINDALGEKLNKKLTVIIDRL